jgi:hypothetical protein|eukprot:COSAG02_NODE_597_length_19775_cov_28.914312_3_plen_104_part_00
MPSTATLQAIYVVRLPSAPSSTAIVWRCFTDLVGLNVLQHDEIYAARAELLLCLLNIRHHALHAAMVSTSLARTATVGNQKDLVAVGCSKPSQAIAEIVMCSP